MRMKTHFLHEYNQHLLIYVVRPDYTAVKLKKKEEKKEEEEEGESRSSM